jgi:membrane associated rhomboid family serine protease
LSSLFFSGWDLRTPGATHSLLAVKPSLSGSIRKLYYPHGPMKRSSNVSATWILLAVNTLIFVLGQKFPVVITLMQRNTRYLIDKYWFLKLGFFGSQFAHRDFTHFVSNMMSLYNIAPSVSRKMHLGFCLID